MKKFLATGMLALCLIAASYQQASAWTNHQFGIGLNWSRQSGGNSICHGLYRNGQPAAPDAFHHGPAFPQFIDYTPQAYAMPTQTPAYAPPVATYPSPYQFATYPRPEYYYTTPYYYYGR